MPDKNKLKEDLQHFENLSAKDEQLIQKLDEFIILLENTSINSENIKGIKSKIDQALEKKIASERVIEEIKEVSTSNLGRLEQLEELEKILNNNYLDSRILPKKNVKEGVDRAMKFVIGFLFVTLGFAMIIMPAPPYFEMFTIFYFNPNDGVTLMDLISLIVIAIGTFIVIRSLINYKKYE